MEDDSTDHIPPADNPAHFEQIPQRKGVSQMIHNAVVPSGYDTLTKFSWAATDLASLDCSSPDARRFKRIFLMIRLCSVQMRLCWERFGTMLGTLIKWVPRHCPPAHLLKRPASQSCPGPGLKTRRPSFPTKPFLAWCKLFRATLLGKPIALHYSSDVQSGSRLSLGAIPLQIVAEAVHRSDGSLQLLAHFVQDDTPTLNVEGVSLTPNWYSRTQTVLRNAFVLCGQAHLHTFKVFDKHMHNLVFAKFDASSGLRGVNVMELLQADRAIWQELCHLLKVEKWPLDNGLNELSSPM